MGGMEVLASTNLLITHPFNNKFNTTTITSTREDRNVIRNMLAIL